MHVLLNLVYVSTPAKQSHKQQISSNPKEREQLLNEVAKIHNQLACGRVCSFQYSNNRTALSFLEHCTIKFEFTKGVLKLTSRHSKSSNLYGIEM